MLEALEADGILRRDKPVSSSPRLNNVSARGNFSLLLLSK